MAAEDIAFDNTELDVGGATAMERLPSDVIADLSPHQRQALVTAIEPQQAKNSFPIDLRISIPFFGSRAFVALIAGSCQRGPERQTVDRDIHPVATLGNLAVSFFTLIGMLCTAFVVLGAWGGVLSF